MESLCGLAGRVFATKPTGFENIHCYFVVRILVLQHTSLISTYDASDNMKASNPITMPEKHCLGKQIPH